MAWAGQGPRGLCLCQHTKAGELHCLSLQGLPALRFHLDYDFPDSLDIEIVQIYFILNTNTTSLKILFCNFSLLLPDLLSRPKC